MRKFEFPINRIKKDSKLIIYGAGVIGTEFIKTINETNYCELVCILDKNAEKLKEKYSSIFQPDHISKLNSDDYDIVLIAIEKRSIAEEIKSSLIDYGVPEYKIEIYSPVYLMYDEYNNELLNLCDDGGSVYKMAVCCYKAIGDKLLTILPILGFRKLMSNNLVIHTYSECDFYVDVPFIDRHYYSEKPDETSEYDVIIALHNVASLMKYSPEKTKRLSEGLYNYFNQVLEYRKTFPRNVAASVVVQHSRITGVHKTMQHNIDNLLPFCKDSIPPFSFDLKAYAILEEYGLLSKKYITISVDASKHVLASPKLWPIEYYKSLIRMIKMNHPRLWIVLVGESVPDSSFGGLVDINLCGKTSTSEICCVLKHSLLHIATEGGLIHLNRAVGGKSCCLFGMTSPTRYAYEENINLRSSEPEDCIIGCENLIWGTTWWRCVYTDEYSPCMKNLLPEHVYDNVAEYLCGVKEIKYGLHSTIERSELDSLFFEKCNCALIGRKGDTDIIAHLDKIGKLTVFDINLAEEPINQEAPINLLYAERLNALGVSAEYGTIHNIPVKSGEYDVVISNSCLDEEFQEYELFELFRIVKPKGVVATLNDEGKFSVYNARSECNCEIENMND